MERIVMLHEYFKPISVEEVEGDIKNQINWGDENAASLIEFICDKYNILRETANYHVMKVLRTR